MRSRTLCATVLGGLLLLLLLLPRHGLALSVGPDGRYFLDDVAVDTLR